ncbi:hypothetical protein Cus16_0749 [Curtobacterium sp. ER1/6]|nr:hypothetical protein Cus16_0749 [Curtobacterium sp. ER1/6]
MVKVWLKGVPTVAVSSTGASFVPGSVKASGAAATVPVVVPVVPDVPVVALGVAEVPVAALAVSVPASGSVVVGESAAAGAVVAWLVSIADGVSVVAWSGAVVDVEDGAEVVAGPAVLTAAGVASGAAEDDATTGRPAVERVHDCDAVTETAV